MRVFFHAFSSPLPVLTEMFTTDREHPDFPAKENPAKKTMCLSSLPKKYDRILSKTEGCHN
jgi:hypothetical protein